MIRINLLKPEAKEIKEVGEEGLPEIKARKTPRVGNLIILLLIVALSYTFLTQKKAMDHERQALQKANNEKQELQFVIAKLDEVNKQKASLEKKINLINMLKSQQGLAVHIMDDLSKCLPDSIWLNETSYNSQTIQVKGNAWSNNSIADFISSLENSPYFDTVNLISSAQKIVNNVQYLEFSLSAKVVNPNQPAAPLPTQETKKKRRTP